MPRWRQDRETGKLIPIDEKAVAHDRARGIIVKDVEPFRSPIDGTIISSRRQYEEHCRKHGVVPAAEFSKDWYDRKAKERARLFTGERTKREVLERKKEIYETMMRAERNGS